MGGCFTIVLQAQHGTFDGIALLGYMQYQTRAELAETTVVEFRIEEASAKCRQGPPLDEECDYRLPVWAGVIPLEMRCQPPVPDDNLMDSVALPSYVRCYGSRLKG